MKKIITYRDWKFEVDFDRTKEIYNGVEKGSPEECGCGDCQNFSANRENIYPNEITNLLVKLGVDYKKEAGICHYCKLENGKHFYGGWFHFKGKILEGKDCRVIGSGGGSSCETISITDNFGVGFLRDSLFSFFQKEENESLIQIEFVAKSDWVIDENLESE